MKNIVIVFLAFFILGCKKDFLNTSPTNKVDDSNVFTTVSNAKTVLNGVYRYMFDRYSNQNQPGQGGIMLQLEFMGEDINQSAATWYTTSGSGTGNWTSHRLDNSGYVSYPYRFYYRIIGNMNQIITFVDGATGSDGDKNMVKAEALTLRAWAYSNLVQIFAIRYDAATKPNAQLGVPLMLLASDAQKPRASVEEVYTQINKDLDDAIALFGNASAPVNKSHLNVNSARGIKARVALTMQDYATAITYAKQVVDENKFPLMSETEYKSGFNNSSLGEWMWAALVLPDQGDTFGSYFAQISYNGNTSYIRGRPKRINSALYAQIAATDVRKTMWEPAPTVANFPLPATTFIREPYMNRKFSIKEVNTTLGDVPYMRSSEMYLILAEAYAKTPGKETDAQNVLFTFASKRNPAYIKSTNTGAALISEILFQRRVELWGEGFRFYDLKRLNQALDRTVVPNYVAASVSNVMQIPAGDPRWQFLIPIDEMNANKGLAGQQNP